MVATSSTHESGNEFRLRSGAASRLAGISASTLRIWEHRYGVVLPPKSATGHRSYSMQDIERLRIIKRLTSQGHSISTVAHLDVDALVTLSSNSHARPLGVQKVLVVGNVAARKLERRFKLEPMLVFDDLDHAELQAEGVGQVDVIVVYLRTLHAHLAARILWLRKSLSASNVIVVYSFGAEPVSDSLLAAEITVRRAPLSGNELLSLIFAGPKTNENFDVHTQSNIRRFSDADLIALAETPSLVTCECPRHLSEIVSLLVEFETYSSECASQNKKDALLHRNLLELTSQARSIMEKALDQVVSEENLYHLVSR